MNDAGFVGGDEARGDVAHDAQRLGYGHLALLLQRGREVRPFEIRHADVLDAVDLAEIVDADDVLVGDLPCEYELLLEAALHLARCARVAGRLRPNDLERDADAQLGIPCVVHGAHAADAEHADDVVAPERLADSERTRGVPRMCGLGNGGRRLGEPRQIQIVGRAAQDPCRDVVIENRRGTGRRLADPGRVGIGKGDDFAGF